MKIKHLKKQPNNQPMPTHLAIVITCCLFLLLVTCSQTKDAPNNSPSAPKSTVLHKKKKNDRLQKDAQKEKSAIKKYTYEQEWTFHHPGFGNITTLTSIPKAGQSEQRFPVLFALHGQGESRKKPHVGARGWIHDYKMNQAIQRLHHPPLNSDDFGGMVTDKRLAQINKSLDTRPYRGIIVICPYLPNRFRWRSAFDEATQYGDFLHKEVLSRAHRELPTQKETATTAIDGVSLGGRAALLVGLLKPNIFGAVGGMQPALHPNYLPEVIQQAIWAKKQNPNQKIRLLSSKKDRFEQITIELSQQLHQAKVPHQLDIIEGDHSYEFNQGPGVYELLLYYDRVLRGEKYL